MCSRRVSSLLQVPEADERSWCSTTVLAVPLDYGWPGGCNKIVHVFNVYAGSGGDEAYHSAIVAAERKGSPHLAACVAANLVFVRGP